MKHDWFDPRPNGIERLMTADKRRCHNCGAEQKLVIETAWMRIVSRTWRPLVGRCKRVAQRVLGSWPMEATMTKTTKPRRCTWFAGCRQMATTTAFHTFQKKVVPCCARCRKTNEYLVDVPKELP